jgi:hypothetical protein
MSTGAATIQVLSENQLKSPYVKSGRLRAMCPVHGGDRQRSLSIQLEGDNAGFGYCHNCHATVLIAELNPEAAQRLGYTGEHGAVSAFAGRADSSAPQEEWQAVEILLLQSLHEHMRSALQRDRARAYLAQRGIPFELADKMGLMYFPIVTEQKLHRKCLKNKKGETIPFLDGKITPCMTCRLKALSKWHDRIIFPLASPAGPGYGGRTLFLWEPGMDENEHKKVINAHNEQAYEKLNYASEVTRFRKTYPAGYFNYGVVELYEHLHIVEGLFDALALLAAGIPNVIALAGTSINAQVLPPTVLSVVLALDGDSSGQSATAKLRKILRRVGLAVDTCYISDDGKGGDWSERYRLHGEAGLAPLLREPGSAFDALIAQLEAEIDVNVLDTFVCACGAEADEFDASGEPLCTRCAEGRKSV